MATYEQLMAEQKRLDDLAARLGVPNVGATVVNPKPVIVAGGAPAPTSRIPTPNPFALSRPNEPVAVETLGTGNVVLPTTEVKSPDISSAASRLDFYKADTDYWKSKADEYQKSLATETATFKTKSEDFLRKLVSKPTTEEKRTEEMTALGIKPAEFFQQRQTDIAQVESLMKSYNDKVASNEEAVIREEGRTAPLGVVTGRVNELKKQQAVELSKLSAGINTQLAVIEMKNNNFTQAQSFVNQAVSDYTYDLKFEYDRLVDFRAENEDILGSLEKKYIAALDYAQSEAENYWKSEEQKATDIGKLMLKYPTAGITFDDTIEEATEKATRVAATTPPTPTPTTPSIFTQTQLNKGAAVAGISGTDFATLDDDTKNYFINNSSEIEAKKKYIVDKKDINDNPATKKENKIDPTTIEQDISSSNLPAPVKDTLVRYLWSVFERPANAPVNVPTWWDKLKNVFK